MEVDSNLHVGVIPSESFMTGGICFKHNNNDCMTWLSLTLTTLLKICIA